MTNIIDESEEQNTGAQRVNIDDFLKGYNSPMTVNNIDEITPKHKDTITPENINSNNERQEYYVRGPKKGQPKPKKLVSNVSYTRPENQQLPNELFTGDLFITLLDIVFPMLVAGANNMLSKKNKVSADDLMLTDKQKKSLEVLADKVAKGINIEANPVLALGVMLAAIYGGNLMALRTK